MVFLLRQVLKTLLHRFFLPGIYRFFCLTSRVDPRLVLFADAHSASLPYSMIPLRKAVEGAGYRAEEHFIDYARSGPLEVALSMVRFLRSYARAGTVFLCSYYLPASSVRKREETCLVQLWHACGVLKRFGFDSTEDIPASFSGNPAAGYDLVTVSGEACVPYYQRAFRLAPGVCQALGVSRTDLLWDRGYAESCRRRFYERYPWAVGKKIALWAPTFRGNAAMGVTAGIEEMRLLNLGEEWLFMAKTHPNAGEDHRFFSPDFPVPELYFVADVLITDYSTVLFEFALLGKPIVLFLPEDEQYQQSRGLYLSLNEIPAAQVRCVSQLPQAVWEAYGRQAGEKDRAFVEKYMGACDGQATERIMQAVFGGR